MIRNEPDREPRGIARMRLAVSCVAWVLAASLPAAAWEVRGEALRADPRLPSLCRVASRARSEALDRLRGDLRLVPSGTPIRWVLADRPVPAGGPKAEPQFLEAGRTSFGVDGVRVVIPARRYLARPSKVWQVVLHEATHAVLAAASRVPSRHESMPFWFREGLALWFSGEGAARVRGRVANAVVAGEPPGAFLKGIVLRGAPRPARPVPAECYLAVKVLVDRTGRTGLRVLVERLADGESLSEILAAMLREPPRTLRADLDTAVRGELRGIVPAPAARAVRDAVRCLAAGDAAAAADLLEGCGALGTARAAAGVLYETAAYYYARALEASGRPADALRVLSGILEAEAEDCWEPEALLLRGRCALRLGEFENARGALEELLERFPDDAQAASHARKLLAR